MRNRLFNLVVVLLTLFGATSPCLCWVATLPQSDCCASVEQKACCCNTKSAMDRERPSAQPALPAVSWQLPELMCVVAIPQTERVYTSYIATLSEVHDRGSPLQSPLDLYALYASFLI